MVQTLYKHKALRDDEVFADEIGLTGPTNQYDKGLHHHKDEGPDAWEGAVETIS